MGGLRVSEWELPLRKNRSDSSSSTTDFVAYQKCKETNSRIICRSNVVKSIR